MIPLASDEDFNARITRGLLRREPGLNLMRSQEAGFRTASDPEVLAWAAEEGRVLLTHDTDTMPSHAYARVRKGQPMPGLITLPQIGASPRRLSIGEAIEDILLVAAFYEPGDLEGQVLYLPLS